VQNEEVMARFQSIVREAFGIDHAQYLQANRKAFVGLGIDRSSQRYIPLFGPADEVLQNVPFRDSLAGYSVGEPEKPHGSQTDVLLLAVNLLVPSTDCDHLNALLLHEACHFVVDSGATLLSTTSQDIERAKSLQGRLRPDDQYHDCVFLQQFFAAARAMVGESRANDFVEIGMKYDAWPLDAP
jgi:hypothetical protein